MPFFQIKNFFILGIAFIKSFRLVDTCSNDLSKPEIFKLRGKVCSYVVLFLISKNDSVRLGTYPGNLQKPC